jgi:hypothetical protein
MLVASYIQTIFTYTLTHVGFFFKHKYYKYLLHFHRVYQATNSFANMSGTPNIKIYNIIFTILYFMVRQNSNVRWNDLEKLSWKYF